MAISDEIDASHRYRPARDTSGMSVFFPLPGCHFAILCSPDAGFACRCGKSRSVLGLTDGTYTPFPDQHTLFPRRLSPTAVTVTVPSNPQMCVGDVLPFRLTHPPLFLPRGSTIVPARYGSGIWPLPSFVQL